MTKRLWATAAGDPMLHFVILAGLLFWVHALFSQRDKPSILVEAEVIDALMRERAELTLRPLTDGDRKDVIDNYIGEEILLREAYRRGLDRLPRVRALLIQNTRFALLGDSRSPSEEDLRTFFEANRSRFVRPSTIDLSQILFADGKPVPEGLLQRLNAGANPTKMGDFDLNLGSSLRDADADDLVRLFGSDGARAIIASDDEQWHGPIHSARGSHFIRIDKRRPAETLAFEQVAGYIADEWVMAQQNAKLATEISELSSGYTIILPPSPPSR
jgi:hypothetical protein